MDNAKKYFFFSAMSYPFIALYDDGACILRAQENSKLPMQISFVANGINVTLNLIFVWVLHLGVAGSSAATMIARAFAMVRFVQNGKRSKESYISEYPQELKMECSSLESLRSSQRYL